MAYIPPHKRQSAGGSGILTPTPYPPPPPSLSLSKFSLSSTNQTPKDGERKPLDGPARTVHSAYHTNSGTNIYYANGAINRFWWASAGGGVDLADLRLECFPFEPMERQRGGESLVLAAAVPDRGGGDGDRPMEACREQQPALIARRILPDLLASAASARDVVAAASELVKLSVVARIGKVLFPGSVQNLLESISQSELSEANANPCSRIPKSFFTDVPNQFLTYVEQFVLLKAGFHFESEREDYHVQVFDKCRPDSTITCKCAVVNDILQVYKIELNQVRHLVVDVSCLRKDFDFRIMLNTKRILNSLDDDERDGIYKLIGSAIIDSNMKGGLRWPHGEDAMAERFSVAGVWHTRYRTLRNSRMRLKLRHSDRFSHNTSIGEVTEEVTIKLSGVAKHLRAVDMEGGYLLEMLQAAIELIWNDLLTFKPSSSS